MKNPVIFSLLLIFVATFSFAQEPVEINYNHYTLKKNQHAISYSPFIYLGYKYAYSFNKNFTFGLGMSLGSRNLAIPGLTEMAKINIFYRKYLSQRTYINLGVFAAFVFEFQPFRGFEGEVFYGWNHFKIGHGLQLGYFDDQMSDHGGEEFIFMINPIIIQFNL